MNGKISFFFSRQRGSLFLAMLVAVIAGGVIAVQLLPSKDVVDKREKAAMLKMNLGQLRQAFDMKYMSSPAYNPDLTTSASIQLELKKLSDKNYLRNPDITDPTIPAYLWGKGNYYWKGTDNFALNASFENLKSDGSVASWVSVVNTKSSADNSYLNSSSIDDYPGQNKLGKLGRPSGTSLKITFP